MRSLAALACATLLGACGSSTPSHGLVTAPSIAINGNTYAAADGGGLSVNNSPCSATFNNIPVTLHLSALVAGFTSYKAVCDYVKANTICANKPSAWRVNIAIINGGAIVAPAAVDKGVYTISPPGIPTPDANGNFQLVAVQFEDRNATCANTTATYFATGTVTVDQVTPTVKGSISATIVDGAAMPPAAVGTISGPFEVDTCSAAVDICGQFAGTCTNLCI